MNTENLNVQITENAQKAILSALNTESDKNRVFHLFVKGYGWNGPRLGLALEERQAEDEMIRINELEIAYDPNLRYYLEGKIIDYQRSFFGQWEFIVYGTGTCS